MRQMSTFYTQISNILWQDAKECRKWKLKVICISIGFSLVFALLLILSFHYLLKFPQYSFIIGTLTIVAILALFAPLVLLARKITPKDSPHDRIARLKEKMYALGIDCAKRQNELRDEIMQSIESGEKEVSISLKLAGTIISIVFFSQIPFFFRYIISHEDSVLNADQLTVLFVFSLLLALALAHMAVAIFPDLRYSLQNRKQKEKVLKFLCDLKYYEDLNLETLAEIDRKEKEETGKSPQIQNEVK